jgi:hypothetical protein
MNLSLKKSIAIIILVSLIPICSAYSKSVGIFLFNSKLLKNDNAKVQQYMPQITTKENLIVKNTNNNEELIYEIKSKKNDLDMAIKSLKAKDYNFALQLSEEIKQYVSKGQILDQNIDNMKENIKIDGKKHDYASLISHMDSVINLQNAKYNFLKEADLNLDLALESLK